MKLTYGEINNLVGALTALKGPTKVLKDKEGNVILAENRTPIVEPMPFDASAKVKLAVAINLQILRPYIDVIQQTSDLMLKKAMLARKIKKEDTAKVKQSDPDIVEINIAMRTFHTNEVEIKGLQLIDVEKLNVDENEIPPEVIASLLPLLRHDATIEVNDKPALPKDAEAESDE